MPKLSYFLFLVFLLNNISGLILLSNSSNYSHGYITPENELFILNNYDNYKETKKFKKYSKISEYEEYSTKKLKILPSNYTNSSISFDINNLNIALNYISDSSVEIIYYNEEYYYSSIFSPEKSDLLKSPISVIYLGNNTFAYIENLIFNTHIKIIKFDFNSIDKYLVLNDIPIEPTSLSFLHYLNCITSINNYIVCIYVKKSTTSKYFLNLIDPYSNYTIKWGDKIYENKDYFELVFYSYLKLIPLEDEKILFCLSQENKLIKCGLAQIVNNSEIKILIEPVIVFQSLDSSENKKFCKEIIINKNEILLGCKQKKETKDIINIANITIINNKFFSFKYHYIDYFDIINLRSFQFLKDNDDNIILLLNYINSSGKIVNEFEYFGISKCKDIVKKIYNGERTNINFNEMIPTLRYFEMWYK